MNTSKQGAKLMDGQIVQSERNPQTGKTIGTFPLEHYIYIYNFYSLKDYRQQRRRQRD